MPHHWLNAPLPLEASPHFHPWWSATATTISRSLVALIVLPDFVVVVVVILGVFLVVLERLFCKSPLLFPLRILVLACLEGTLQNII